MKGKKDAHNVRTRMLWVIVITIGIITLLLTMHDASDIKYMFDKSSYIKIKGVLEAEKRPSPGGSIFFHKSGVRKNSNSMHMFLSILDAFIPKMWKFYGAKLTLSEACSVESAAIHHPNLDVFVLFVDQSNWIDNTTNSILATLLTYPNVHIRTVDLRSLMENTPLNGDWHENKKVKLSVLKKNSLQLLRYLSLWYWGGTFLDFDTIVLRNMAQLSSNYVVVNERTGYMTTSILNFSPGGVGHQLVKMYIENLLRYSNEHHEMISREAEVESLQDVTKQICYGENIAKMVQTMNCFNLKVYGNMQFGDGSMLNSSKGVNKSLMSRLFRNNDQWYVIYNKDQFWNRTKPHDIVRGPRSYLVMKHCPRIFKIANKVGF